MSFQHLSAAENKEWQRQHDEIRQQTRILGIIRIVGRAMMSKSGIICNALAPNSYQRLENDQSSVSHQIGKLNLAGFYTDDGDGASIGPKKRVSERDPWIAYIRKFFAEEWQDQPRPRFVQAVTYDWLSGFLHKGHAARVGRKIKESGPAGLHLGTGVSVASPAGRRIAVSHVYSLGQHQRNVRILPTQIVLGFQTKEPKQVASWTGTVASQKLLQPYELLPDNLLNKHSMRDLQKNFVPVCFVSYNGNLPF